MVDGMGKDEAEGVFVRRGRLLEAMDDELGLEAADGGRDGRSPGAGIAFGAECVPRAPVREGGRLILLLPVREGGREATEGMGGRDAPILAAVGRAKDDVVAVVVRLVTSGAARGGRDVIAGRDLSVDFES